MAFRRGLKSGTLPASAECGFNAKIRQAPALLIALCLAHHVSDADGSPSVFLNGLHPWNGSAITAP